MRIRLDSTRDRAAASQRVARSRSIARNQAKYFELTCGHLTTKDVSDVFACWAPARKPHYCEKCREYIAKQRKPKRGKYPEKPPF